MNASISIFNAIRLLAIFAIFFCSTVLFSQNRDVKITISLRGVHSSKISLLSISPSQLFKPIREKADVLNGDTAILIVPSDKLPGEFVLRFDYRETAQSTPYPSERYLFLYNQDVEFHVSPMFCNNPDSSYFQDGERENSAFSRFMAENNRLKEKLGVLQNFLMGYDDTKSDFYREGIKEYEKRREDYNKWLVARKVQDKEYFVSNLYDFQFIPEIPWEGSETERLNNLIDNYFDGTDFQDSLMIRSSDINKWMDNYVNLYGQQVTSMELRDSLFSLAGKRAIEKAKTGHPKVYGWMVDYFYRGYETNGIDAGMKVLAPYLDDPRCLTSKRQEIERRLKGIATLVAGTKAPDISLTDDQGGLFNLYDYGVAGNYILVLFWSADCPHCEEMTEILYPWWLQEEIRKNLTVIAISLDETETEMAAWKQKTKQYTGWKHLNAPEGVRSKVASDYYILATPEMFLLDATTRQIIANPKSMVELKENVQ